MKIQKNIHNAGGKKKTQAKSQSNNLFKEKIAETHLIISIHRCPNLKALRVPNKIVSGGHTLRHTIKL